MSIAADRPSDAEFAYESCASAGRHDSHGDTAFYAEKAVAQACWDW